MRNKGIPLGYDEKLYQDKLSIWGKNQIAESKDAPCDMILTLQKN